MERPLVAHEHSIHACPSQVVAFLLLMTVAICLLASIICFTNYVVSQMAKSSFLSMMHMQPPSIWRLPIRSVTFCHFVGNGKTTVERLVVHTRLPRRQHSGCPLAPAPGTPPVIPSTHKPHQPLRSGALLVAEGSLSVPAGQHLVSQVYATAHSTTRTSHNIFYKSKPSSTPVSPDRQGWQTCRC